jgi:hypothetical protein
MNLVCFADDRMSRSQHRLIKSAEKHGIDNFRQCSPEGGPKGDFWWMNHSILCQERGAGYWLWKPFIIYAELTTMEEGEILFYSDSGVEIIDNLKYIEDKMNAEKLNVFLFSGRFKHAEWCKADVIQAINHQNLTATETQSGTIYTMNGYESFLQVQASNMFFRNTPEVRNFVKAWLCYCQYPGFIDDSPSEAPNFPGFSEHRHDQAILTCLAIKENLKLHWFPSTTNMDRRDDFPGDDYPPLFLHHRMRNNEYD